MHVICSTFGSAGDVFPMLGLALELRSRGHEITFVTNPHFERVVTNYHLRFEPLGTEADFEACIRNPELWQPRRGFQHIFNILRPGLKQQYAVHARHANDADVVGVTNCFGFGAFMAQDQLGIPVISLHLQPAVLWSNLEPPTMPGMFGPRWLKKWMFRIGERFFLDPIVWPYLNEWRRELGLPPRRHVTQYWNSPNGVVCMFPEWYCPPQADWPPNVIQADFPLWNHRSDMRLSEKVEEFLQRGDPPIVFTPGSANLHAKHFFETAVQACQALGRRGILLTEFPEQLPRSLPDSVAHFRYVPLDLVLPRAAAFVHHGGVGSMSQAMAAGIPQVLMPLAHDQFDNAARVQRLGIGDSLPAKRFTRRRLVARLTKLLTSPAVSSSCREIAQKLTLRDGLRRSAIAVEEFAAKANRDLASRTA